MEQGRKIHDLTDRVFITPYGPCSFLIALKSKVITNNKGLAVIKKGQVFSVKEAYTYEGADNLIFKLNERQIDGHYFEWEAQYFAPFPFSPN